MEMDPQGAAMMGGGGGGRVYEYAEIWPGFQASANATPYGMGLDPMLTGHGSNHGPVNHGSRKRKGEHDEMSAKGGASTSNSNGGCGRINGGKNILSNGGDGKREKAMESNENNIENEKNSDKRSKQPLKPAEPSKQDYIHVRARRGQATDSHSLAERARREKISERMKILQDLVPGCNKVIGKALVLDEIINYIQSLQHQVEFLSMKLEAVNKGGAMDGYPKDQPLETPGMGFGSQNAREYNSGSSPDWLHMQISGSFERMS